MRSVELLVELAGTQVGSETFRNHAGHVRTELESQQRQAWCTWTSGMNHWLTNMIPHRTF